jgi:hypothetical protein
MVSARDVEQGGTITIGEEHINLKVLDGSDTKYISWWASGSGFGNPDYSIDLKDSYSDASFPVSEFGGRVGNWYLVNLTGGMVNKVGFAFRLVAPPPTPTTEPTPVPTPTEGNIVISSSPSDATVYVDNVIKGITPLTVSVANGEHVVRIRLDGYHESTTSVTVLGKDVSIKPVLIPLTTTVATTAPTTVVTTIPTTVVTTVATTAVPTTEVTTVEATPEPTMALMSLEQTVEETNNDDTLANMQSQIDEQSEKIEEQNERIGVLEQMIDFILRVFGLK